MAITSQAPAPHYLAAEPPPTATVCNGEVLVEVAVESPPARGEIGEIGVLLPVALAKHLIVQLEQAVAQLEK